MTIDPRMISWDRWSAETQSAYWAQLGTGVPQRTPESDWTVWANAASNLPALAALSPQRPVGFSTWSDWALRFNATLQLLGAG